MSGSECHAILNEMNILASHCVCEHEIADNTSTTDSGVRVQAHFEEGYSFRRFFGREDLPELKFIIQ